MRATDFLKKAFSFVIILIIIYISTLYIVSFRPLRVLLPNVKVTTGKSGYSLLRFRDAKKVKDVDILFLGSSTVYRGIDPRIFSNAGINVFTMGSSSQTPVNSFYLLKEYMEVMRPKYVILDLYWVVLNMQVGTESTTDIISNSELSPNLIKMAAATLSVVTINTLLCTCFSRLHTPINHELQKTYAELQYVHNGYAEANSDPIKSPPNNSKFLSGINKHQLAYLGKIINYCSKNKTSLIMIRIPVCKTLKERIANYKEITLPIRTLCKKNTVKFLDFNDKSYYEEIGLSCETDFYDLNHLGKSGVKKFNNYFISKLNNFL